MRTIIRNTAAAWWGSPVRNGLVAAVAALLVLAVPGAEAQTFTPRDENPEEFPAGKGRDETFYACTACHGFKLIAQQGLNRRQWEESLDWMTVKHGMPKLDDADRKTVLDYLEATYPPRVPAGRGSPNPFLTR
jgi:mono/diheme cytochrome c family protein